MRRKLALWLTAALMCALLFAASAQAASGMVRVKLTRLGTVSSVTVSPTCEYYRSDSPEMRFAAGSKYTFRAVGGRVCEEALAGAGGWRG
ncbi:MAG: hypothetical protein MJ099_02435, partial [Clostridia bacterium]|nr:hypothetical protein [Clostridia bacterium]